MSDLEIPLFTLRAVLFPGGLLPLRIFEARYLDMVSRCMKQDSGFGICLIRAGQETGPAASVHPVGTLAKINDWQKREDGLLGVTARGLQRFTIVAQRVEANQLLTATARLLPPEPDAELPTLYLSLANLLCQTLDQLGPPYTNMARHYASASWVSSRLTELLPLTPSFKQELLQLNDPLQRLKRLSAVVKQQTPH